MFLSVIIRLRNRVKLPHGIDFSLDMHNFIVLIIDDKSPSPTFWPELARYVIEEQQ